MTWDSGIRTGHQPTPPPPPQGGPSILGLFPKDTGNHAMYGGGVSVEGGDPDQPPDTFCAPSHAGKNCNPVEG